MGSVDDLWLVDFGDPYPDEPALHRPALIVGPPSFFGLDFPYRIVIPLTTTDRSLHLHVAIEPDAANGLDETSFAQCEQLRSISRTRLVHQVGTIDTVTSSVVSSVVDMLLDR